MDATNDIDINGTLGVHVFVCAIQKGNFPFTVYLLFAFDGM